MSPKGKVLRFYIEQDGKRSSIWRVWDNNNGLYNAIRNIAGIYKASLHESNYLNFAITQQFYKKLDPLSEDLKDRHYGSLKLNILPMTCKLFLKLKSY